MNRLSRNFKLLLDDIETVNFTNPFKKTFDPKQEKREILLLYRHLLKNIPKMHESLFEQKYAYEVINFNQKFIKFNFQQGSRETDRVVILKLKNIAYTVIEKINKGVYPPFPKYI
jgi:hypothetical protein